MVRGAGSLQCTSFREALSARADGEQIGIDQQELDNHVAGCAGCRSWAADLERMRRVLRVGVARSTPDLTAAIMAAAELPATARRPRVTAAVLRQSVWRTLLAAVAVAQLLLGLAQLVGLDRVGDVSAGEGMHLFDESTAWNVALGIGFAVAALWPRLSGGLVPTLTVFVVVLVGESIVDLVAGRAVMLREASHLVVVVGMVLLWIVFWSTRGRTAPTVATIVHPGESSSADDHAGSSPIPLSTRRRRGVLRIADRHIA